MVLSTPNRSPLVGRGAELEKVELLLDDHGLVTVVGPGGVGKTSLALAVAARRAARHEFGCRVVELSRLSDGDGLADAVLGSLGIAHDGTSMQDSITRLGHMDLLVVLDNCEHLLGAVAELLDRLGSGAGTVRVLATSRERIAVRGEQVMRLDPLDTDAEGSGWRLFIERARAVGFEMRPEHHHAVARVVRRLDGLPLAIEMAAALLDTMTCAELADLLDEHLATLHSAWRSIDTRHETFEATIAWSEQLLTAGEQQTFDALSIFAGPVTIDAVQAVLGSSDAVAATRRLVSRSLVSADLRGDQARYRMLEPVRAVVARRLVSSPDRHVLARRHAEYFVDLVREADRQLRTPAELGAHQRLDGAFGELRAAHRWAREHWPSVAVELTAGLHVWAYLRARDECFAWADQALRESGSATPDPRLIAAAATRAAYRGRLDESCSHAQRVLDLGAGQPCALPALEALSDAFIYGGQLDVAAETALRLAGLAEELGDLHYLVMGRGNAALAFAYQGRFGDADRQLEQLSTVMLSPTDRALAAFVAGETLVDRDPDLALRRYEEAREGAEAMGTTCLLGVISTASVALSARHGNPRDAVAVYARTITEWRRTGNDVHQQIALRNLPTLLQRLDAPEPCATVLGTALRAGLSPTYGEEAARLDAALQWARAQLDTATFDVCYRRGALLDLDQAARNAVEMLETLRPFAGSKNGDDNGAASRGSSNGNDPQVGIRGG